MTGTLPPWDDALSVGVPALDDQHRTLFRVLAALGAALKGEGGDLPRELDELLRDCSIHFADEEAFLEAAGYPRTVQQRVQHRRFVARLSALAERVGRGDEAFTRETLDGLASWLRGHVLGLDREYADWLRSREG